MMMIVNVCESGTKTEKKPSQPSRLQGHTYVLLFGN